MFKGFREFALKGNIVELALAVVIGTAVGALVKSFTESFINPLVARFLGAIGFSSSGSIPIGDGQALAVGAFITGVVTFVLTVAVVYYAIVVPMNRLRELNAKAEEVAEETPSEEIVLLTEIRDALRTRP